LGGKTLAELAGSHAWAYGCGLCRHGLLAAPDINAVSTNPLYLQRAIQAAHGDILFCDCRAGCQMRIYLRQVWATEMKLNPNLRNAQCEYPVPTIRYVTPEAVR
jgi:hypothetical protein